MQPTGAAAVVCNAWRFVGPVPWYLRCEVCAVRAECAVCGGGVRNVPSSGGVWCS